MPEELFWFMWCISEYKGSYCERRAQELRDSGMYYDVEIRGHRIWVQMGRDKDGQLRDRHWFETNYADRNWWPDCMRTKHYGPNTPAQFVINAHHYGKITDWQVWDICSNHNSPLTVSQARLVYESLGFEPFAGYPLKERVSTLAK